MLQVATALLAISFLGSSLLVMPAAKAAAMSNIEVLWSVDVDQRKPNAPAAFSAPALVTSAGKTLIVIGGRDRWVHVYALDGWEERRIALQGPSDSGALALNNGLVVLSDTAGRMYAVDPKQGDIVWKRQLTASFSSIPVAIGDDFLVQTTDNRIYRFSQDGVKRWSFSGQNSVLGMYLNPSPLVVGSRIYAVLSNGDAVALKSDSGDLVWKRQLLLSNESAVLSELKAPLATPIFVPSLHIGGEITKNVIVAAFFQGDLFVLGKDDGAQSVSLPLSLKSSPVIAGNTLYAADSKGFLHAYDIKEGRLLWKKRVSNAELRGPVLWHDSLWLTDDAGSIFRMNRAGEKMAETTFEGSIVRLPEVTEAGLLLRSERGALYMVR